FRFFFALFALILAIGITFARCSRNNNNKTVETRAIKPQQSVDKNQMNPQPREKLRQGGKMTWAIPGAAANFNFNQIGADQDGKWITDALIPNLFLFDGSGTPVYNKDYLAAEPKLETSPRQVVTYEINPKAIWYDGTTITAADFISLWKALR